MASNTKVTTRRRKMKRSTSGKRRKKAMANKGTTPKFSVHQNN